MQDISMALMAGGDSVAAPRPGERGVLTAGRAELKYCVPGPISERALDVARRHLTPDVLALGPRQRVTSLYLDTAQLTFLRWHRERAADRFKLRIRRYGDRPASLLYAEVKRKTGSVVRKRRAAFAPQALHAVLNGGPRDGDVSPDDRTDLREFVRRRSQSGATPRMLVTCIRESLRDPADGTAVTVDRDLLYQPTCRGDLIGDAGAWHPMALPAASDEATTLVEMKFSGNPPAWMAVLILQLRPWRVSFSKYAMAMNHRAAREVC